MRMDGWAGRSFDEHWQEYIEWLDHERVSRPRSWFVGMVFHDRWRTAYWVCRQINLFGGEAMARGKTVAPTKKKPAQKAWTTFVEIPLTGYTIEDVENAFPSPDAVFEAVQEMAANGYRLSISHNETNDAMIASVTCKDEDSPNAGCTFTAFARDWFTALKIAAYKHYNIAQQEWQTDDSGVERPLFG